MSSWWPWSWMQQLSQQLWRIEQKLDGLSAQGAQEMALLDDLEAKVAAMETVEASAITLMTELSAELKAAIAANDPARIQAVVDKLDRDNVALADAVVANTPAA